MLMPATRWRHFAAMVLIGDGVMALVRPQRDAAAWDVGPDWWRCFMRRLQERPALTRAIGGLQVAAGIWWAITQEPEDGSLAPDCPDTRPR